MKKPRGLPRIALLFAGCLILSQCSSLPDGSESVVITGSTDDGSESPGDMIDDFGTATGPGEQGRPPETEIDAKLDAALMVVSLDGAKRNLVIQLNAAGAPETVVNFKRNVARGYYDGLALHRVIPNYIIQTGDPLTRDELSRGNWGTGGPGYTIPAEPGLPHAKGAVAMARLTDTLNPNHESSGSQFYICLRSLSKLDRHYTVFGNVIQGLEVLDEIARVRTDENDVPVDRIEVESIKLVSSKSRFARQPGKTKSPKSKPDASKGGFEKLIERIW